MAQRTCPHDKNQDGVCGCPEFWKHVKNRPQLAPSASVTRPSTQSSAILSSASPVIDLRSPSPTPPGPPKQTCFFWYHGQCKRGRSCHLEHEVHPRWPIVPPPRYVHREACSLTLCPLREDLVALKQAQKEKPTDRQLGGQVDGAVLSRAWATEPESYNNNSEFDSDTSEDEDPEFHEALSKHVASSSPGSEIQTFHAVKERTLADNVTVYPTMSNEEFEALPDWSDVEDDPVYNYREKYDVCVGEVAATPRSRLPLSPPHWPESPNPATFLSDSEFEDTRMCNEVIATPRATAARGSLVPRAFPTVGTPSPTSDNVEYLNLSGGVSPPPCSEIGSDPLLSLSHAGTLGNRNRNKRRRSASPHEQTGDSKRRKRESTPDLSGYMSILERKRRINNWGLKPLQNPERPERALLHADTVRNISSGPNSELRQLPSAPKDPRALGGIPPICFYWYHKGYCKPARRYGRIIRCLYSHTLDIPHQRVSLPPNITDHPNCNLELCPVRLQLQDFLRSSTSTVNGNMCQDTKIEPRSSPGLDTKPFNDGSGSCLSYYVDLGQSPIDDHGRGSYSYQQSRGTSVRETKAMDSYNHAMEIDTAPMEREHRTPVKCDPSFFETSYSSSPRDAITEARKSRKLRGPKFDKNNTHSNAKHLPKLAGDARQRFKIQKKRIEQWQMKNGVVPDDPSLRLENRKLFRKQQKESSRNKKTQERNRLAALALKTTDNMSLDNVSVASSTQDSNAVVGGTNRNKKKGGKGLRSRRAQNFYEADLASGGKFETFDAEAELYHDTFRPIAGFPEPSVPLDERDEREKKQQSVLNAMEMVQAVKETPKILYPLTSVQPTLGDHERDKQREEEVRQNRETKKARKPRVLVDYDLPSGDERLDWDTDEVRLVFGEIEW